jgi:hypothetical protein
VARIILPSRFKGQPQHAAPVNWSHPSLSGVSASIITYGGANNWVRNQGKLIAHPTFNGAVTSGNTTQGRSLTFDGTSTYLDYGTTGIPGNEFTLLMGCVFNSFDNYRGVVDCTSGGVGWNIFQTSGGGMWFSVGGYGGNLPTTGWPTGTFVNMGLRNKPSATCDWFRNGVNVSSSSGGTVGTPIVPLLVGNQRGGGIPFMSADVSYFILIDKFLDSATIASLQGDPYQILQTAPRRIFYTASPPGTVGLTGQGVTSAQGTLAPSTSVALAGQAVTIAKGTLSPTTSIALTGQVSTSAQGTLSPATSVALTGQAVTSAQGTLSPSGNISVALTGTFFTVSQGTVGVSGNKTVALTGQSTTSAQGTLSPSNTLALTGQAVTSAKGSVAPATSISLAGQAATSSQGSLTPVASGQSITIQLTGQSVTAFKGSVSLDQYLWDTNQGMAGRSRGTFRPLKQEYEPEIVEVHIPARESTHEQAPIKNVVPTRQAPRAGLKWDFIPLPPRSHPVATPAPARDYRSLMAQAGQDKKTVKLSDFPIQKDKKYLTKVRGPVTLKGN